MGAAHSALGPSGAHRWKACPGSVNAERLWRLANPGADDSSVYAEEGTRAHELAERLLNNPDLPVEGDAIDTMEDHDMLRHCLRYRDYCQALEESAGALTWVERIVKMPAVHASCFGTVDFATYSDYTRVLHCVDLKYGAGQYVDVHENPQAMLYAEGMRQHLYDKYKQKPRKIVVHIYQPRLMQGENIASYEFSNTRLNDFVHETHLQALATQTDVDTFVPGDKQCHWCKANPCATRAQQMQAMFADEFDDLEVAIEREMEETPLMDNAAIAAWLERAAELKKFIARVEGIAYERAMSDSEIPGFKLVEGRASYKPRQSALEFVLGADAFKAPEPRSMTDLKKHLGARRFALIAQPYYKRVPGKPTLVSASDPRATWDVRKDLEDMFEDL